MPFRHATDAWQWMIFIFTLGTLLCNTTVDSTICNNANLTHHPMSSVCPTFQISEFTQQSARKTKQKPLHTQNPICKLELKIKVKLSHTCIHSQTDWLSKSYTVAQSKDRADSVRGDSRFWTIKKLSLFSFPNMLRNGACIIKINMAQKC